VKKVETIMEILAADDLTHSYGDAAELVGCAPNTVARYVRARDAGLRVKAARRDQLIDRRHLTFRNCRWDQRGRR
jgi:hypothetical protein